MTNPDDEGFIPPSGGYENLLSYQKALIIYDGTYFFTKKWLPRHGDRTVDQMVQAARSGKQNIVEGSSASATSKEMEIKLTNVARSSLEELKEDYKDFLRTRQLPIWDAGHRYRQRLEQLNRTPGATYETFKKGIESDDPEISANVLLGLTAVAVHLLKRQISSLEQSFLKEGGLRERMTRARLRARDQQRQANPEKRDPRDDNDPKAPRKK
jgi:four helix bundle suffix protein